jgi:hypothetical protein
MFVNLAAVTLAVQLGSPFPLRAQAKSSCFKPSTASMRIRRRAGMAGISVPVTGSATRTVILRRKIRQPGDIRDPRIAVADTPYRAATAPTSIFAMASVTPTARCHRNFSRDESIAVPNMTRTTIPNAGQGVDITEHCGSTPEQHQSIDKAPAIAGRYVKHPIAAAPLHAIRLD